MNKPTPQQLHAHDTAKAFYLEEFQAKLNPYTKMIKVVMKANKVDAQAALIMMEDTSFYKDNPFRRMMFIAAVVELIQPKGTTL